MRHLPPRKPNSRTLCTVSVLSRRTSTTCRYQPSFIPFLRFGLLFRIGGGRRSNQVAGIRSLITRDETLTDAGVHSTVRAGGVVRKAGEVFLDEAFLEVCARVSGHDFIAQLRRKLIEPHPDYIEKNT